MPYDNYFLDYVDINRGNTLLDIGGGNGTFAKLALDRYPNLKVLVLDPSMQLLNKINDSRIIKVVGSLPNDIPLDTKFYYINLKEVLHHVVGSSINESKNLLVESLKTVKDLLDDSGYLFIHELFYDGYVIESLPRYVIFYLLRLQNLLQIKIPRHEFIIDLNVCFYTRREFENILINNGFKIMDYREEYFPNDARKKLLFLKEWGRMMFVLKKKKVRK